MTEDLLGVAIVIVDGGRDVETTADEAALTTLTSDVDFDEGTPADDTDFAAGLLTFEGDFGEEIMADDGGFLEGATGISSSLSINGMTSDCFAGRAPADEAGRACVTLDPGLACE